MLFVLGVSVLSPLSVRLGSRTDGLTLLFVHHWLGGTMASDGGEEYAYYEYDEYDDNFADDFGGADVGDAGTNEEPEYEYDDNEADADVADAVDYDRAAATIQAAWRARGRGNPQPQPQVPPLLPLQEGSGGLAGHELRTAAQNHAGKDELEAILLGQSEDEEGKAGPDSVDARGNSALHRAALGIGCSLDEPKTHTLEALISLGARPDAVNAAGETPLHVAAGAGYGSGVAWFLNHLSHSQLPLHASDERGLTPLLAACGVGSGASIAPLVQAGAGLDPLPVLFRIPDGWGLNHGYQLERVPVSPLWLAAKAGSAEGVQALVQADVDLDARGPGGLTPLAAAAAGGCDDVVDLLLEAGADPEVRDESGLGPFEWAIFAKSSPSVHALAMSGILLDEPIRVPGPASGWTPLMIAASLATTSGPGIDVLLALLEEGCLPSIEGQTNAGPLSVIDVAGGMDAYTSLIHQMRIGRTASPYNASKARSYALPLPPPLPELAPIHDLTAPIISPRTTAYAAVVDSGGGGEADGWDGEDEMWGSCDDTEFLRPSSDDEEEEDDHGNAEEGGGDHNGGGKLDTVEMDALFAKHAMGSADVDELSQLLSHRNGKVIDTSTRDETSFVEVIELDGRSPDGRSPGKKKMRHTGRPAAAAQPKHLTGRRRRRSSAASPRAQTINIDVAIPGSGVSALPNGNPVFRELQQRKLQQLNDALRSPNAAPSNGDLEARSMNSDVPAVIELRSALFERDRQIAALSRQLAVMERQLEDAGKTSDALQYDLELIEASNKAPAGTDLSSPGGGGIVGAAGAGATNSPQAAYHARWETRMEAELAELRDQNRMLLRSITELIASNNSKASRGLHPSQLSSPIPVGRVPKHSPKHPASPRNKASPRSPRRRPGPTRMKAPVAHRNRGRGGGISHLKRVQQPSSGRGRGVGVTSLEQQDSQSWEDQVKEQHRQSILKKLRSPEAKKLKRSLQRGRKP